MTKPSATPQEKGRAHREFYLDFDHCGYKPYARVDVYEVPVDGLNKDSIHVIEYAALEDAKAEIEESLKRRDKAEAAEVAEYNKEIQSLKDRLAFAVLTLEFINNRDRSCGYPTGTEWISIIEVVKNDLRKLRDAEKRE